MRDYELTHFSEGGKGKVTLGDGRIGVKTLDGKMGRVWMSMWFPLFRVLDLYDSCLVGK